LVHSSSHILPFKGRRKVSAARTVLFKIKTGDEEPWATAVVVAQRLSDNTFRSAGYVAESHAPNMTVTALDSVHSDYFDILTEAPGETPPKTICEFDGKSYQMVKSSKKQSLKK
jgi:hypothetical protein